MSCATRLSPPVRLAPLPGSCSPATPRAQDLATPIAVPGSAGQIGTPETVPIDHLVVIFLENRPFDHLYGLFPGANGLLAPEARIPQTDADGVPYVTLPPVVNSWANPPAVDTRFPSDLPNEPFLIEDYVPLGDIDPSPTHRFYQHQLQVNGGRMDRYVVWSDTGGLPLGTSTRRSCRSTPMPASTPSATTSSPPPGAARCSTTSG